MPIQIHYWSDDVERLAKHYVDVLGFDLAYRQPDEPPANFCILRLGDATIMIAETPVPEMATVRNDGRLLESIASRVGQPGAISVYIAVEDVDAYCDEVAADGAIIIEPIWDAPWGLRQFSLADPDGNLMTFHGK